MLIDEIIEMLSDESSQLSSALLKTRVFLFKIGKKELAAWPDQELAGYANENLVPPYRTVRGRVKGYVQSYAVRAPDFPLPIMHLDEATQRRLTILRMPQSVAVLENITRDKNSTLQIPLPSESGRLFAQHINGSIEACWIEIQQVDLRGIIFQIRSKILDFMLELKDQIGENVKTDAEVRKMVNSGKFDTNNIFSNAVFGNNTTVIVGNANNQNAFNSVYKGDFSTLRNQMAQWGIPNEDLAELEKALNSDAGSNSSVSDGAIGSWLSAIGEKIKSGSVKVGESITIGVITKLLSEYISK